MNESDSEILETRETSSIERFHKYKSSSELFVEFHKKGFTTFPALKVIVKQYYPDVDIAVLKRMWQMQQVDENVKLILEDVYEKLRSE